MWHWQTGAAMKWIVERKTSGTTGEAELLLGFLRIIPLGFVSNTGQWCFVPSRRAVRRSGVGHRKVQRKRSCSTGRWRRTWFRRRSLNTTRCCMIECARCWRKRRMTSLNRTRSSWWQERRLMSSCWQQMSISVPADRWRVVIRWWWRAPSRHWTEKRRRRRDGRMRWNIRRCRS